MAGQPIDAGRRQKYVVLALRDLKRGDLDFHIIHQQTPGIDTSAFDVDLLGNDTFSVTLSALTSRKIEGLPSVPILLVSRKEETLTEQKRAFKAWLVAALASA